MEWIDLESDEEYKGRLVEEGRCPNCGSNVINYVKLQPSSDGTQAYWTWECSECETKGEEWHDLRFIRHSISESDE